MASAVTTHPKTSSLSNNRGTDLISLLFSLQTSVAKVKPERSEYADTISGLRPFWYKVPRMALPSMQMMSVAEAGVSLRKTRQKQTFVQPSFRRLCFETHGKA